MTEIWSQAAIWLGLALIATLLSIWLRIATALSEIVVGAIAQLFIGAFIGAALLGADYSWGWNSVSSSCAPRSGAWI